MKKYSIIVVCAVVICFVGIYVTLFSGNSIYSRKAVVHEYNDFKLQLDLLYNYFDDLEKQHDYAITFRPTDNYQNYLNDDMVIQSIDYLFEESIFDQIDVNKQCICFTVKSRTLDFANGIYMMFDGKKAVNDHSYLKVFDLIENVAYYYESDVS